MLKESVQPVYAQQYVVNDLMDKTPVELIRLLYSKAIEKLRQAIRHTEGEKVGERSACLARAMQIVAELQGSLNLEDGGELALELARLYDYAQRRLIEAAGDKRAVEPLEEVRVLLSNLCEGWNGCDPPPAPLQGPGGERRAVTEAGEGEINEGKEPISEDEMSAALAPVGDGGSTESRVWTL